MPPVRMQVGTDDPVKHLQVEGLFQVTVKTQFSVFLVNIVIATEGNDRQAGKMRFDPARNLFGRGAAEAAIQQDEFGPVPPDHFRDVLPLISEAVHPVTVHLQSGADHI